MRGGAREGAGAKPTFEVTADTKTGVRLNDDDALTLVAYCKEMGWAVAPFIREAALAAAGIERLGVGFTGLDGTWLVTTPPKPGAKILPVSLTPEQRTALRGRVSGRPLSTFMREAALERVSSRPSKRGRP